MESLWHRTLEDMRGQFRAMRNAAHPLLSFLVEFIQSPDRLHAVDPTGIARNHYPQVLPEMKFRSSGTGGIEEPHPLAIEDWPIPVPEGRLSLDDESGKKWAAISLPLVRHSEYRCDADGQIKRFLSMAEDAGKAMLQIPPELLEILPATVRDLIHSRAYVRRFKFGNIDNEPKVWVNVGHASGIMRQKHGVLVDWVAGHMGRNGKDDWITLLHRLAWVGYPMPRLEATRFCWGAGGSITVQKEMLALKDADAWTGTLDMRQRVDPTSWYSVIGKEDPTDMFEASARAIDILLEYAKVINRPTSPAIISTQDSVKSASDDNLTPRQKAIILILKRLRNGAGLEGKEIASRLPRRHRRAESTLRRHDFPPMIDAGVIVNTPGVGYHLAKTVH